MIQLDTVSFIWAHFITLPSFWSQSFGTAMLLQLSVLSFMKGLCGIIWVQILGERVEEPMHVYVWLYMMKPEASTTALHSNNCN